ncbi:hypothetical protein LRM64_10070 [Prescottella equi]|uniref:hypothetical protein n=1 Tax=Rhodococcus hoagii TaxID=43767 RepID=UPI0021D4F0A0|nr:hypothetical protein [Prescottella equi]MCU7531892.1 hypothetical protein [Prescottella equi]MCU7534024.1 hypothetical protein [Prescottella equi]
MDTDTAELQALPYEGKCLVLGALWQAGFTLYSTICLFGDEFAGRMADDLVEMCAAALDG